MSEHTALPWRYQEKSDAYTHIVRSGDRFILQLSQDTSGQAEATARFIVRAVNAHAALVKALTDIIEANAEFVRQMPESFEGDPLTDACSAARLVLDQVNQP